MLADRNRTEYLLLNQDVPFLRFHAVRNEFDEPEFFEDTWYTDLRPIGYRSLTAFLERRKAPKHREHIRELLERYDCDDLEGFLRVTHALSLNDTFWVRQADSDLCWDSVSLYRNEFDQLVSEAAFDGTISETDLSSTSPEFGTDGYYAKCWIRRKNEIYLYKSGSALNVIEPLSEYLASQLSEILCPDSVQYDLDRYHGKLVSTCPLFTSEGLGLAKGGSILRKGSTVPEMLRYFADIGAEEQFRRMCVLDAVIMNPDRHLGNFGVLFDNDTLSVCGMAPVFDNNRSLFPELDEEQLAAPEWYMERCKPRIGRDFIVNARGMLTDDIRSDLRNLLGFKFTQHPEIEISALRLRLLEQIVEGQIRKIL